MTLTDELKELNQEIRQYAKEYGLDFFETIFEIVDFEEMNEVASYGGFPNRYPHWRFGMEYEHMCKSYAFGLHKIYEMVINNNPCYAYLLECNNIVDQKIVMAHVYGHSDFFKNNYWFSHANRKMLDEMANHSTRIMKYIDRYGLDTVENFLDACLSLENLIDVHSPFIKREEKEVKRLMEEEEEEIKTIKKLPSKEYMNEFINPPEFLEFQKKKLEEEARKKKKFPENSQQDVVLFLIEYAPLEKWQRDIFSIIREEAYYFAPQAQTKIINEGWATYWHSKIMTEKALKNSELIDYADHHAGTLGSRPGVINPYKIGLELFRDIEDRWDKGKFGKEYEECDDMKAKKKWDEKLGLGKEKIFEVRKIYNDVTFIDTFLTEEFCEDHKLFTYEYDKNRDAYIIKDRDYRKVKEKLLFTLTNFCQPFIYVQDGNYENKGELYLCHKHESVDLKIPQAKDTLRNLYTIWQRPVNLETIIEGKKKILRYDGKEHREL